jgi:hypothetical protein
VTPAERPPLDLIVLFPEALPPREKIPALGLPLFQAFAVEDRLPLVGVALHDLTQPLEPVERLYAARARAALHLRCEADVPPVRRLPGAVARARLFFELGAVAVVLPAAHKVVGPRAFARTVAASRDDEPAWTTLFVHHHEIPDGDLVWIHTHGLEHFGLPDVETYVPPDQRAAGRERLERGIRHLMADGGFPGDLAHDEARPRADHAWGAWGAWQLLAP